MSNTVIKIENVSKLYRLGKIGTGSLKHDVNRWWHTVRGKEDPYLRLGEENDRTTKSNSEYVWALKDISFEVERGDVLGIIGKNGAGKSTLLKLLSRTTLPTKGSIKVKGRIASLLEVGTGFHPELTGRENIFLNGAILGMTKAEIKQKFNEIVDFSGVEKYIDTPVKRYSSGMYVRLAFGVAAHLEPEILIVDEVLAVGDAEFQKKALGKMQDVSKNEGRTVLFVSHNIAAVKSLCKSGIFLSNGILKSHGEILDIVDEYYEDISDNGTKDKTRYTKSIVEESNFDILQAFISDRDRYERNVYSTQESICVHVTYKLNKRLKGSVINFSVENRDQTIFLSFDTDMHGDRLEVRDPGLYEASVKIPSGVLKPGRYSISFNTGIANLETYLRLEKCLTFSVVLGSENETFISYSEKRPGLIAMPLHWETQKVQK